MKDMSSEIPTLSEDTTTYPVTSKSEQLKPKNKFAVKLTEIRANSAMTGQKVVKQFDQLQSPTAGQLSDIEIVPGDVFAQLEELSRGESLSSSEFFSRSKQVLQASTILRNKSLAEVRRLKDQEDSFRQELASKDTRAIELSHVKGLKRISANRERKRLAEEIEKIKGRSAQLGTKGKEESQLAEEIKKQEGLVRQKQEQVLISMVGQEVKSIRNDYEKLLEEILQDGTITSDIRETFIQEFVTPDLELLVPEMERRNDFFKALHAYIDHRGDPSIRTSSFRHALESFSSVAPILVEPLINKDDESVIRNIVAKIAADDIRPIRNSANQYLSTYDSRNKLDNVIIVDALGPPAYLGEAATKGTFGKEISKYLNKDIGLRWTADPYHEIQFWQAVKHSGKVNEISGEEIQKQDQAYYLGLIDQSLGIKIDNFSSGPGDQRRAIRDLRYYPTADTIRNLVLLASAYPSDSLTENTNNTLYDLSKRKDWQDILDDSIKAYPTLKAARQVLEKSSSMPSTELPFSYRRPEIQDAAGDFALAIFEDTSIDPRLRSLAAEALPNARILDVLVKKGLISTSDATSLKEAELVLKNVNEEILKKQEQNDFSVPQIQEYYFHTRLEGVLSPFMRQQQETTVGKSVSTNSMESEKKQVERLVMLSREIIRNQSNSNVIRFLSSSDIINKIEDQTLNDNEIPTLLSAYEGCPALITVDSLSSEFLSRFCDQFSGQETVRFFNNISTAYKDRRQDVLRVLDLVRHNSLTQQRALELPAKAGDVFTSGMFYLAIEYPKLFLTTDQDIEFLRALTVACQGKQDFIRKAASAVSGSRLTHELALAFPGQVSILMDEKMKESLFFVLDHADTLVKESSDFKFFENLVLHSGNKPQLFISTYQKAISSGAITTADRDSVLKFARDFFQDSTKADTDRGNNALPEPETFSSEEMNQLEKSLGLENKENRLIEASLFIDQKFMNVTLITDNTQNPERMFGVNEWMDYLEARKTTKEYGNQQLTLDFMLDLQKALTKRSNPKISGQIRNSGAKAATYNNEEKPVTYTAEQVRAIEQNPQFTFIRVPPEDKESTTGFIEYPHSKVLVNTPEAISKDLNELCDWYNSEKNTGHYNPFKVAAVLQQKLISIHPFEDANGTFSRLLMNWSLENDGEFPSILDDPSDDILTSEEKWTTEVEKGSKKYHEIKSRQLAMKNAEIEDLPDIFGLGQEQAFYEYVFKHIKSSPQLRSKEGKLIHEEYDQFIDTFMVGYKLFRGSMHPNSIVDTQKGPKVISQGGLISSAFIKSARSRNPNVNPDNFFSDVETYRGGMTDDELSDGKMCEMFLNYVGVGTGYRALRKSFIDATSERVVEPEQVAESMEYYNRMVSSLFFNNHNLVSKNPYRYDLPTNLELKLMSHASSYASGVWDSPFVSTSLDITQSRLFTRGSHLKYGMLFKARTPKEGNILCFGKNFISGLSNNKGGKEILVAGGLQPSSIFEIEAHDWNKNSGTPVLIARRVDHAGNNGIEIEDRRGQSLVKRFYRLNLQTRSFELSSEETINDSAKTTVSRS